ncbi:MAG TPA: response regulator transcription factor [bacterium]
MTIIIIEDNRYVREAMHAVLQSAAGFEVLGAFESCELAFATDKIADCDAVLMDIGLPGMSGIDGVRYLNARYPDLAIIMCTVYDDDENIFDALCAGAVGYLLKKVAPEDLLKAIRDAVGGGSPMTPNIARKVIKHFQKPATTHLNQDDELTEREIEVLHLLAHGKSYAAIGGELFLSVDGVRYHIRHIYEKLQVNSRTQAIAKGLKERLIQPPR